MSLHDLLILLCRLSCVCPTSSSQCHFQFLELLSTPGICTSRIRSCSPIPLERCRHVFWSRWRCCHSCLCLVYRMSFDEWRDTFTQLQLCHLTSSSVVSISDFDVGMNGGKQRWTNNKYSIPFQNTACNSDSITKNQTHASNHPNLNYWN